MGVGVVIGHRTRDLDRTSVGVPCVVPSGLRHRPDAYRGLWIVGVFVGPTLE